MSTADTPQPALIDRALDQAVSAEAIASVMQGDQRMAGAEGPLQSHPQGLAAVAQAAPTLARSRGLGETAVDAFSQGAAALGGVALSGIHGAAAAVPFLQALLRPLVANALRYFAGAIHDAVIVPLEAELRAIAANHPDVNLDRANAAVGSFYASVPDLPQPATGPNTQVAQPQPAAAPTRPVPAASAPAQP